MVVVQDHPKDPDDLRAYVATQCSNNNTIEGIRRVVLCLFVVVALTCFQFWTVTTAPSRQSCPQTRLSHGC